MGNRFTEPTGLCSVTNKETGHKCELEVKSQYNGKASDTGKITGSLKDENEQVRYTISGKYGETIEATNAETGETFTIFTAPKFPKGPQEES